MGRLGLILLSCLAGTSIGWAAEPWKLQPLPYNNPGLTVDLGVGLWAWPMPLDYDEDDDMDLLVACPDKPSNGVYFFENPTQDPTVQQPVFLPGVRIGPADHNYQISFVNKQPRILATNREFGRRADLTFDFENPKQIFPKKNIHGQEVRANMWRYVDFDGDGDHDLSVGVGDWTDYGWDHAYDAQGQWRNGPLHGYVYILVNHGSDEAPMYTEEPRLLTASGSVIDVYGWPSPSFADFDNDGDLDLLCGEFLDGFTYFANTGSRQQPAYATGVRLTATNQQPLVMDLQMITPTAVDWDSDGDSDLIVGDEDGRVAFIEHTGQLANGLPVFQPPRYFQQQADTLKFGALATPFAVDWDGDNDQDILCGNTAGQIGWFENLGTAVGSSSPTWSRPSLLSVYSTNEADMAQPFRVMAGPNGSIQGPAEAKWGYSTLSVADWDQDSDLDIIFNSILSRVELLRNMDGKLRRWDIASLPVERGSSWNWNRDTKLNSISQWRTTPVAIDFDHDGKLDYVGLDQEGYLTIRKNFGASKRIFVDPQGQAIRLNSKSAGASGRVKLALGDWNGDSLIDVIVNSENALLFLNQGIAEDRCVLLRCGNLADRNVSGHSTSPAMCDFDMDSKPDLLIGAEDGRLYHICHDDCARFSTTAVNHSKPSHDFQPLFEGHKATEFIFQDAPFAECHASTICETSRGLVAAWFGGSKEGKPDVGIWTSYHDGQQWSAAKQWADGVQHTALRYPCWNPVLYQPPGDAPTLLFFKVGPSPSTWWGEAMVSFDRGRTFRDRKRLPEGIDGPVRCKPILLPDGKTLLAGSSTEYDGWRVHFEKITLRPDGNLPTTGWRRIGPINVAAEFNAIQPTFLQHADGRLQVLCRTQENVIASSFSSDHGDTWTKLQPTDLPNPNSGIDAVTLDDGRHLLVYNHLTSGKSGWGKRGNLSLAVSTDGLQWSTIATLENEPGKEFSYPAIIQTGDGQVHITYTWNRKRIKHVVLDPSQL